MRVPVEVAAEVDDLGGVIWTGSQSSSTTLVEFFDYNCPYCRKAAGDLHGLLREIPDLRLGLVNNPILSPSSEGAARIELAVLRLGGPLRANEFHLRLFGRRGVIDAGKALAVAQELGAPVAEIEQLADHVETRSAVTAQLRVAASLGMAATPSFMVGRAGIFGTPDRPRSSVLSPRPASATRSPARWFAGAKAVLVRANRRRSVVSASFKASLLRSRTRTAHVVKFRPVWVAKLTNYSLQDIGDPRHYSCEFSLAERQYSESGCIVHLRSLLAPEQASEKRAGSFDVVAAGTPIGRMTLVRSA